MNIVFFSHPAFVAHQSMPRFVNMLAHGMRERGHSIEIWAPPAKLVRLPLPGAVRKWLGYADQYVLFPADVRSRLKKCSPDTLFVFADQALGPWVQLVADQPHVIHCHDFLAQRSALGEVAQNPTSWTGRQYQAFIRRGYTRGKYFISVSETTRQDLHRFLLAPPAHSEVVYNGLNQHIIPLDVANCRAELGRQTGLDLPGGYLLHVGGNQWYKNREGVLELYTAWRTAGGGSLPLLLVGEAPTSSLLSLREESAFGADIHFLVGLGDEQVRLAYAGATVFLFPSLAEGFGWPIAEAMAAGCPVITTEEAPMTEVGSNAVFYLPRRPESGTAAWAAAGAQVVQRVVALGEAERERVVAAGLANAARFEPTAAISQIEAIYQHALQTFVRP